MGPKPVELRLIFVLYTFDVAELQCEHTKESVERLAMSNSSASCQVDHQNMFKFLSVTGVACELATACWLACLLPLIPREVA